MPVVPCPHCDARYKVPATAAGKRTTCKKCGQGFRIPAAQAAADRPPPSKSARLKRPPPQPAAAVAASSLDDWADSFEALAGGEAIAPAQPLAEGADVAAGAAPAAFAAGPAPPVAAAATARGPGVVAYGRYLTLVGSSFGTLFKPMNLLTLLGVWIALAIGEIMKTTMALAPLLGFMVVGAFAIVSFIIAGWYMAFQLKVVQWAAGEEDSLPGMGAEDGLVDGVIIPFFHMLATKVAAYAPVVLYLVILYYRVAAVAADTYFGEGAYASPVPPALAIVVLILLALAGLFIWPMLVLVVACGGGMFTMFRLDLILETIFKSFPAYLLTVLAVCFTFGLRVLLYGIVGASVGEDASVEEDWAGLFLLPVLLVGINLYFDVIAMRAIGYYYACFKHRFAWDWG